VLNSNMFTLSCIVRLSSLECPHVPHAIHASLAFLGCSLALGRPLDTATECLTAHRSDCEGSWTLTVTCTEPGAATGKADRRLRSNGDDIGEDATVDVRRITRAGAVIKESSRTVEFRGETIHALECCRSVVVRCGIAGSECKEREDCDAGTDGESRAVLDANESVVLARLSISSPMETVRPTRPGVSNVDADFTSLHVAASTFSWRSCICTHMSAIIFRTPTGIVTVPTGSVARGDSIDPIGVVAA